MDLPGYRKKLGAFCQNKAAFDGRPPSKIPRITLAKRSIFRMHELVIIGAGPHALSLLTALMEPHTDKYLEHPSNSLLFHRSGAEANNFESQAIIARGHQYNALRRQRKSEKEVVDNALNGVGKRGRRSKVAGQTDDPSLSWIKENVVVLDRLGCTQCNNRNNNHGLGDWMPFWRKQMDFLVCSYV